MQHTQRDIHGLSIFTHAAKPGRVISHTARARRVELSEEKKKSKQAPRVKQKYCLIAHEIEKFFLSAECRRRPRRPGQQSGVPQKPQVIQEFNAAPPSQQRGTPCKKGPRLVRGDWTHGTEGTPRKGGQTSCESRPHKVRMDTGKKSFKISLHL